MNTRKQKLILVHMDKKIQPYVHLIGMTAPDNGWAHSARKALNMSLRQLGKKMSVTPQSIKALEEREKKGTISINSLKDLAKSMDMQLVYALVPNDGSLDELINKKAMEIAKEIVNRTSQNMKLEDQENSAERINDAFEEKKNELKNEMPKFLWD